MKRFNWLLLGVTLMTSLAGCYATVGPDHPRHARHHDVVVRERVVYERDHRHYH